MLVFKDNNNLIYAYNDILTREEATPYLENGALWLDELEINPPEVNEDERVEMYLNGDATVNYVIVKEEAEFVSEHDRITKEVQQTTSLSADDNLINMELLLTIDDKLNLIMEHLGLSI